MLLEGLEKVDGAITSAPDIERAVADVLAVILDVLGGERAVLLYPCDPQARAWHVVAERARPGLTSLAPNVASEVEMTPAVAGLYAAAARAERPIEIAAQALGFGPGPADSTSAATSIIAKVIGPKLDRPYLLGWQRGAARGPLSAEEERLLIEVGRRLRDLLSNLAAYRKLRDNDRTVEQAERMAQLGYWERDFVAGIVRGSTEALRILGLPADQHEQNLAEWHQRWRAIVHADDREHAEQAMGEAVRGGAPYDVEYRVVRPNGDVLMVHSRAELIRDDMGRPHRMVGFMQDITARTRLEEQLLEMSDRFRLLSESRLVGIFLAEEGRFRYVNDAMASTFGYSVEELVDVRGPVDLVHPDDKDEVLTRMRGISSGDVKETRYEHRGVRKDGDVVNVEVQCRRFEHGGRVGVIGTMLDISERKRLEQQFREAQKMDAIGRLAGGIAHDFNNLLTIIQTSAEMALVHVAGAPANELLTEVRLAADRAAALTRQLLAFSRRQVLRARVVDLNQTLKQVAKLLRRLIGENIDLTLALDPRLRLVKVDPDQLAHAIINLAVNARDAMPQGGRITVATENVDVDSNFASARDELRPGPYVRVAVSDTGHGMDAATAARIFEPFFTTKPVGKGTGLGLAMVYGFLKQSDGHVEVESGRGGGATFRLYLPQTSEAATGTVSAFDVTPTARGVETVLLVEDDDGVRRMCKLVLQANGYTVLEARDGAHAIEIGAAHTGRIDIVITDVVMPRMGGRQVAEELLRLYPETCVLFFSGYADETALPRELGPRQGFLQKPFPPTVLAGKVRELLDAARPEILRG